MSVYLQDIDDWIPRVDSAQFDVFEDVLNSTTILANISPTYSDDIHDDLFGNWPVGSLPYTQGSLNEEIPFSSQANSAFNLMIENARRPLLAYAASVQSLRARDPSLPDSDRMLDIYHVASHLARVIYHLYFIRRFRFVIDELQKIARMQKTLDDRALHFMNSNYPDKNRRVDTILQYKRDLDNDWYPLQRELFELESAFDPLMMTWSSLDDTPVSASLFRIETI